MADTTTPMTPETKSDLPNGAIHNGEEFIIRLENNYSFRDELGHNMANCADWEELKRCFHHLAQYAVEKEDAYIAQAKVVQELVEALKYTLPYVTALPSDEDDDTDHPVIEALKKAGAL